MAVYDSTRKEWINDATLAEIAKMQLAGSDLQVTKDDWQIAIEARAEKIYKDLPLSPAQKFARCIGADAHRGERLALADDGDPLGKLYYEALKVAPKAPARMESKTGDIESLIADERLAGLTLEQVRAMGPNRAKDIPKPLRGAGDTHTEEQQASRGLAGANPTKVASPRAGAGARKSDEEKERAQRQYLASPSGWPQI